MDITPNPAEEVQTPYISDVSPAPTPAPVTATTVETCTCASCTTAAETSLLYSDTPGFGWIDNKKKTRYAPPQPDANTFATQQAFLDSLAPVTIDSIDENSKKCPICWKPYGEAADPGFDNSEQPVKLKCKHLFGDKCLRATFALPGTSTITLRPLAFSPGSRGRVLGQRLHAYAQKQPKIGDDGNVEVFANMLAAKSDILTEWFGEHWHSVIAELRRRVLGVSGVHTITLLENAMILDRKPVDIDIPALPSEVSQAFTDFPGSEVFAVQNPLLPMIHPPTDSPSQPPPDPQELLKQQELALKIASDRGKAMAEIFKAEREKRDRNERELDRILAVELARVYSDYLRSCLTAEEPEQEATLHRKCFVPASIFVHKRNLKQSSYEVDSLDRYISRAFQQEDDMSDTDGDDDGISDSVILENLFPVIIRKVCTDCCSSSTKVLSTVPILTSLWWKNTRKIPDDCPICHKVLFHKEDYRQKPRYLECETSGDGDHDDETQGKEAI